MAQVCGDSLFDFVWRRIHNVALRVMRQAADSWATRGRESLSQDAVIAVFVNIYLSEWCELNSIHFDIDREARSLQGWLRLVTTARAELIANCPKVLPDVVTNAARELEAEMSLAIGRWTLGDPESPSTEHAINAIECVLFDNGLTRRPPNPKLPMSLLPPPRPIVPQHDRVT
jgi:hypothetical protein